VKDDIPSDRFSLVTVALIVASIAVYTPAAHLFSAAVYTPAAHLFSAAVYSPAAHLLSAGGFALGPLAVRPCARRTKPAPAGT